MNLSITMNRPPTMNRIIPLLVASSLAMAGLCRAAEPAKPNVLFIAIDDLRDWVGYLGDRQVKTPNLDKLAQRGVYFTRSYTASPCCNPSRSALLTGLRPSTSGVYGQSHDYRKVGPAGVITLPRYFKDNGYYVAGAGKIFHNGFQSSDWDDYITGGDRHGGEEEAKSDAGDKAKEGWDGVGGLRFGALDCEDKDMRDYRTVSYILEKLGEPRDKPFFLACGIVKPHMPWSVPKKYYDMYPLDKIELPKVKENDLNDVPPAGIAMANPDEDHAAILESGRWKEAVQAYLATITFCDAMVGRLIEEFDKSPCKDNTIICLWSDHGWHLGEKQHWRKFALWEEATRAPYIWIVPGVTKPGGVCNRPVDFMDIYPTLCDLAGLPVPRHLDGTSIRTLLEKPDSAWDKPAITTWLFNNHTIRTERWRYIRYADGGEELYDHERDPLEWVNLAQNPEWTAVKADLANWLPKENKPWPERQPKESGRKNRKAEKRMMQASDE